MKRLFTIILAVVLGYAWLWTGLLKDKHVVDEKTRFWILIAVTLVFIIQQVFLTAPKPVDRSRVESRRQVIELKLSLLLSEYYKQLASLPITPAVRANLSLPTRVSWRRWRLKIYYYSTSDGSAISNDELDLEFKKREGAIGRAWAKQDVVVYGRGKKGSARTLKSINKKKLPFVKNTESVLAVPILEKDKTIGVMCLDSEFPLAATLFDQLKIATLARSHADHLAGLCFFDGVK